MMEQRIISILQSHPRGLTAREIANALKEYGITDTEWDYAWQID